MRFDVVLFDLGGVLVRLTGVGSMRELAGLASEEDVWARWLACRWVRDFERGWCSPEDFAAGVVADWQLPIEPAIFLEQFTAWPGGLLDGAREMVTATRTRTRVGCLSNTNQLHWATMADDWGLADLFDVAFVSHQLGLVKPDRDLFDHVITTLDTEPRRILFLDDNAQNTDQARAAGLSAAHVRGVDEARHALAAHGVLPWP